MAALVSLQAIQAMVRQAMGYFDSTPDQSTLVELIKILQTVTEGKVHVTRVSKGSLDLLGHMCPYVLFMTGLQLSLGATASMYAQIYVEIERARLTKRLAKIEEAKGNVSEAADILQEVAVVRYPLPWTGWGWWVAEHTNRISLLLPNKLISLEVLRRRKHSGQWQKKKRSALFLSR